jgi:hypothetical protein
MWQHLKTFYAYQYANILFLLYPWKWEGKIKAVLPYAIWGKTNIKLLLGNAGNNEENNYKPDHNRSKLLGHWQVKDK